MSATLVAPEKVTARQENSVDEGAAPDTGRSWPKVAQLWPRQSWYVVAFAHELSPEHLVARTVLGEHLVMFRSPEGVPVVLADRCPHRQYPLSKGSLADGRLVCGYHGFSFDCARGCVAVPGQDHIPSRADARTYAVTELGSWVFVWMGDASNPDWSRLPRAPWLSDPRWKVIEGMAALAARFQLLADNLLDLSHESYLHAGLIGTPEVASTPIETTTDEQAHVVRVNRHMQGAQCPAFYANSTGLSSPIDRWQDIEYYSPGFYVLHSRLAPAGVVPEADGSDPSGFHMKILYGLTPSTAGSCYDFWAVARDFAIDDEHVTSVLDKIQREVVQQDVDALEILEQRLAEEGEPAEVSIKIDRGGLAARRMNAALLAAETAVARP